MVRNYKRKTQSDIDENAMKKAVAEVLTGAETATSAGKKYNIKRQTIKSRVKKNKIVQPVTILFTSQSLPRESFYDV